MIQSTSKEKKDVTTKIKFKYNLLCFEFVAIENIIIGLFHLTQYLPSLYLL